MGYTNVYVKYIPAHWDEDILRKIFEEGTGGTVNKFELWRHDYGTSACLNFSTSDAAKAAVEKLNGKDVASFGIPEPEDKNEDEKKAVAAEAAAKKAAVVQPPMIPTKLYVAR